MTVRDKSGGPCRCLLCRFGDEQGMEELRVVDAEGPEWEAVAEHIVAYTLRVLLHQYAHHTLIQTANVQRVRAQLHPVWLSPEDARVLAADPHEPTALLNATCARALHRFRHRDVLERGWQPGGRAVTSWFVTRCYFALGEELTAWRRERERDRKAAAASLQQEVERVRRGSDEELRGLGRERLDALVETMPEPLASATRYRRDHDGTTWAEAALALGVSPRVIEAQLRRWRRGRGRSE